MLKLSSYGARTRRKASSSSAIRADGLLCLWCRREIRSGAHRDRWRHVDESGRTTPACRSARTARRGPLAYHRIGKHAFERVHGVRFTPIAARLRREWKQLRAARDVGAEEASIAFHRWGDVGERRG